MDGPEDPLHLVLEVKGERNGRDDAKHDTMRRLWLPALNSLGPFGRWSFAEVDEQYGMAETIRQAMHRSPAEMSDEFWRHKTFDELMTEQGTTESSRYENLKDSPHVSAEDAEELWETIADDRKRRRERARRS